MPSRIRGHREFPVHRTVNVRCPLIWPHESFPHAKGIAAGGRSNAPPVRPSHAAYRTRWLTVRVISD